MDSVVLDLHVFRDAWAEAILHRWVCGVWDADLHGRGRYGSTLDSTSHGDALCQLVCWGHSAAAMVFHGLWGSLPHVQVLSLQEALPTGGFPCRRLSLQGMRTITVG